MSTETGSSQNSLRPSRNGFRVCASLADGLSPTTAQNAVTKGAPDLAGVGADIVVDAAATYLCPEEEEGRPGLGLPPNMQHGYS